ncbi:hypothetical protein PsorP6_001221 [Peronosclerospora sorghi]|uniref:Uncharacterized protein n=1 Tax=Peronosclerospora sorghi TaxID=230839 RepID=A0ACC0WWK4_9STRA|nr:hypothetical protein PsorP6_001221 [Peronosclerospora sorghi]
MKRNFGSANLAALDVKKSFGTTADVGDCSLEERFGALNSSAINDTDGAFGDENVGFPIESIQLSDSDEHSPPISLRMEAPQDIDMKENSKSAISSRIERGDMRMIQLIHPSLSEIRQNLNDQHHVELNAIRCLSLKLMMSNMSTSDANPIVASTKPTYTFSGVNENAKAALLPVRHPSLQSV